MNERIPSCLSLFFEPTSSEAAVRNSYCLLRFFAIRSARLENAELSISSPSPTRLLPFLFALSSSLMKVTRRDGLLFASSTVYSFFEGEPLSEGKNALGVFNEVGIF